MLVVWDDDVVVERETVTMLLTHAAGVLYQQHQHVQRDGHCCGSDCHVAAATVMMIASTILCTDTACMCCDMLPFVSLIGRLHSGARIIRQQLHHRILCILFPYCSTPHSRLREVCASSCCIPLSRLVVTISHRTCTHCISIRLVPTQRKGAAAARCRGGRVAAQAAVLGGATADLRCSV
jgi:hypothetical protein